MIKSLTNFKFFKAYFCHQVINFQVDLPIRSQKNGAIPDYIQEEIAKIILNTDVKMSTKLREKIYTSCILK